MDAKRIEKSNFIRYYVYAGLYNIMNIFTTGAIIQTFFTWKGLTSEQVATLISVGSVCQTVAVGLSCFLIDKIKNVTRIVGWALMPRILLPLLAMFLALDKSMATGPMFYILMVVYMLFSLLVGLHAPLTYKIPYCIINIDNYGKMESISGVMNNLIGIGVSSGFVLLTGIFSYRNVAFGGYFLASLAAIVAVIELFAMRKYPVEQSQEAHDNAIKTFITILKAPYMRRLAVPNLMRGIGQGIFGMSAVIMISELRVEQSISSVLSVVMAIAIVLGCLVFNNTYRRIRITKVIVVGGVIGAVFMSLMITGRSPLIFVLMYFLTWLFFTFVDYGIPVYVTQVIRFEHIGGYSAIRMLLHTAGLTLGTTIAGILISHSAQVLLVLGGGCVAAAALGYYFFDRQLMKDLW